MATISDCLKWTAMVIVFAGTMWFLDWNEHRSPWGRDVQAAKVEMLKAKLCN